jgi:conjugal transfer pilus assembly protein TraV
VNRSAFIPLGILPLLAACATTGNIKGDFQCSAPGGSCAPLSVIDAGAVSSMGNGRSTMGISDQIPGPRPLGGPFLTDGSAPPRTSDRVLRVVFPAHIDSDGIYREESAAHAVVENAAWAQALGVRPPPPRGTPSLRTSGIAVEQTPRSALATLDEIVAARAARPGSAADSVSLSVVVNEMPPVTALPADAPAGNTAALRGSPHFEPVASFSGFASRSVAPQSLAEAAAGLSAPKLPALDPRNPAANYDTPDVAAIHSIASSAPRTTPVPVVAFAPASVSASVSASSASASAGAKVFVPAVKPRVVAVAIASDTPYGTRPVHWKGRTYKVPYKNLQPPSAVEQPSQSNPTAELNKAALAKVAADRPGPVPAAVVALVAPTKDAQIAMARVRAMAAPIIANGVDKGRQAAIDAAPEGFKLPISSISSVPK